MVIYNISRKVVITGGPCSGKSTLIKRLAERGYSTITETAREVLADFKGQKDFFAIQMEITRRQLEKEKNAQGTVFLDRGIYDGYSYAEKLLGFVPRELACLIGKYHKYDLVFITDLLPFENDGLRVESSQEEAKEMHLNLQKTYTNLGYSLIRVPVMPIEERTDFVLSRIQNLKGGV